MPCFVSISLRWLLRLQQRYESLKSFLNERHLSNVQQLPGIKRRVTRKLEANEDNHGRRDKVSSFLVCYRSEPKCAAYLGYTDLGEFRKFEFSFIVLEYFNIWGRYCTGKSSTVPRELVRDIQNPDEGFPQDTLEAARRYGPDAPLKNPTATPALQQRERETNANYLMATLIYRLAQQMGQGMPNISHDEAKHRQVKAIKEFEALASRSVPPIDPKEVGR